VATDTFDTILSEARKLRLNLVLCHQYLGQVSDRMRQSVIGNAGTLIVFRVGAEDTPLLSRELATDPVALTDTPNFQAWVKRSDATLVSIPAPEPATGSLPAILKRTRPAMPEPELIDYGALTGHLSAMSVFTSPYNSPSAQFKRLSGLRKGYAKANEAAKFNWENVLGWAFMLFIVSAIFTFAGAPLLANLCLIAIVIPPIYYAVRFLFVRPTYPHDPLTCPYCKKTMPITTPWTCGHCGTQNAGNFHEPKQRTFAEQCARCNLSPSAIACRKCSKAIIFNEWEYKRCPSEIAYITGYPPKPKQRTNTLEQRRKRLRMEHHEPPPARIPSHRRITRQ
jgi:hypothetical protein